MSDVNDTKNHTKPKQRAELRQVVIGAVLANVICWGVYLLNTPRGSAWPVWVTFGTLIGVFSTYYSRSKS